MKKSPTISIKINVWFVVLALAITNITAVLLWQPWNINEDTSKTITVTGTSTVQAEPDQYVFRPRYQAEGKDASAIKTELNKVASDTVDDLKDLGASESSIKTNVSVYSGYYYSSNDKIEGNLYVTITIVDDKDLAQKVQDYLVKTDSVGGIGPYISFSTEKQKQLEDDARAEAIKDARSKAETTTQGLGASLGKVVSINFNGDSPYWPLMYDTYGNEDGVSVSKGEDEETSSSSLQPGLNDYTFTITVRYAIH